MIISTAGLSRSYGDLQAVDSIDIEVSEGEIYAFLGPHGAGKTTTVKMLCGILRPSGGQALVAGYDIAREPFQVRKKIGMVFQEPTLDENMTAYENLYFHGMIYGLAGKHLRKRTEEVLNLVTLWDRKDDLVKTFSAGMKRRLEIFRGLLHTPSVLFLDEPTAGLDPQTRMMMWETIQQMRSETGISVFVTTHYPDEAEYCDRVTIIDNGSIIASDSPLNLKKSIRGEHINIITADKMKLAKMLHEKLGLNPQITGDGIVLEVENAETVLPRVFKFVDASDIQVIQLVKPTLEDVFVNLTAKNVRETQRTIGKIPLL